MNSFAIETHPSPNHDVRPCGVGVILLHYTGMVRARDAVRRLCDADAKVSAHYVILEDGACLRLVDEDRRAWHAGLSFWQGKCNLNDMSIGIELVNRGHGLGYHSFAKAQMRSLILLCSEVMARHSLGRHCVLAHSDVAPLRRRDPGELFDWHKMAQHSLGCVPLLARDLAQDLSHSALDSWGKARELLGTIGYDVAGKAKPTDYKGSEQEILASCLRAFQRHYLMRGEGAQDFGVPCALTLEALRFMAQQKRIF